MNVLITQEVVVPPIPEPESEDNAKRELEWSLDGVPQTPLDEPNGQPFEVVGKAGQKVAATVIDTTKAGVKSDPSAPIEFTLVDDIKPATPAAPTLGKKSKRFKAAV